MGIETLAGVAIGGGLAIMTWSYVAPILNDKIKPYEMALIEYKVAVGKGFRQIVKEHKTICNEPNYADLVARRIVGEKK